MSNSFIDTNTTYWVAANTFTVAAFIMILILSTVLLALPVSINAQTPPLEILGTMVHHSNEGSSLT